MATREENLKKINDELEQLTDEELEQVAGGDNIQTRRDAWFLNALLKGTANAPKKPEAKSLLLIFEYHNVDAKSVKKAWDALGINFKENILDPNDYVVRETGKSLTQAQAWTYASKLLGRE